MVTTQTTKKMNTDIMVDMDVKMTLTITKESTLAGEKLKMLPKQLLETHIIIVKKLIGLVLKNILSISNWMKSL